MCDATTSLKEKIQIQTFIFAAEKQIHVGWLNL